MFELSNSVSRRVFAILKILMELTLPGFGERYQQHAKYGLKSECTITEIRLADANCSSSVESIGSIQIQRFYYSIDSLDLVW